MINVKIITPKGLYRSCEAKQINARSVEGEFGLLEHHMPMVAMLAISRLELVSENERHRFAIAGGLLYFQNDEARILTDSIESEDEIDLERAKRAKERAEKRLASKESNINMRRAEIALQKAINRIHIKENK